MRDVLAPTSKKKKICIVGAGLVGSLLSIMLAREGFSVDVYEKREDPRGSAKGRGRSIAMSLSERGWNALRLVGLESFIRPHTNPKHSRMVHLDNGTVEVQHYGDQTQSINTINRRFLNITLIEAAIETKRVRFFFNHVCEDLDPRVGTITFTDSRLSVCAELSYDHIFGADGIFSRVCDELARHGVLDSNRTTIEYGYKELHIPATKDGDYALPNGHVHVWPRKNAVLIALPTIDKDFVCTLFLPQKGNNSIASLTESTEVLRFFEDNFKEAMNLMPNLPDDFIKNPASSITQVKVAPWHYKDKVLLIGDACHSVTPFYAMGMNVGFEDCVVFMDILRGNDFDFAKSFEFFSLLRKPDTDALCDLSSKNLSSISESPDPAYNRKWSLERELWLKFPDAWIPAYVLIAFTHRPLSEVVTIIQKQDAILCALTKDSDLETFTTDMLQVNERAVRN